MTIDSKKNIWICHFGGACITVYNLKGKRICKIELPAKNITNCTFGGIKNRDLYIKIYIYFYIYKYQYYYI